MSPSGVAACNERVIVSPVNNEERSPKGNLFRTQKLPFGNAISTGGYIVGLTRLKTPASVSAEIEFARLK